MLRAMERELAAHLLLVARTFAHAKELSLTTVGRMAASDGRFFLNLEDKSKSFTARKYDEVLAFFSAHWPDNGVAWPQGIYRPDQRDWEKVIERVSARAAAKRGRAVSLSPTMTEATP